MTTLAEALASAARLGLDRLDAQILLLHALGRSPHDRAWLIAHDADVLPDAAQTVWTALLQRRQAGEPVAYLLGHKAFFGLDLQVGPGVLVPRPDTETLVEWALSLIPTEAAPAQPTRVLDLGTGSGAIALALGTHAPQAELTATDASEAALAQARANGQRLGLPVRWRLGHWLDAVPGERFHLIVSNPPYIAEADPHLAALTHEPLSALTAGPDGLDDIRHLVATAPGALHPGGWLLLEHGYDQAAAVRALLSDRGFETVSSRNDLAGIERCTGGRWPLAR
ncbi:peptide chain release factor N(5)-glutamine methyltransferase [Hydrogenophaga electricum]|uniref:Release factor glutamine methyltransferase n=1 Tax=Hydrogenophaga electricum TaxID=1230953 RepID=A0ABQ6CAQ3_9BURK|nr:peptide chain release factor N(5)-glutamine methyltransferase [Hydrogenophaga electricum]GLS15835.1 release factor glutamine methyltransferase [Hydrogenophaga electricum]